MAYNSPKNAIKCILVGSVRTGKTCLLTSYINNEFSSEYVPTVFEHYCTDAMVSGIHYRVDLKDTSGMDYYDSLRPLDYYGTDIFLVCFSVVSPTSFDDVKNKWIPEITSHCTKTPFILIGTQIDLRSDSPTNKQSSKCDKQPITNEQGWNLTKELGGVKYLECSALTQEGLTNVFDEAFQAALGTSDPSAKDRCTLM